jgi:integrase
MPKLTDSSIKAAKCPTGKSRLDMTDAGCAGLVLRVTPAGSKSFQFKYWSPQLSKTVGINLGSYPGLDLAGARQKVGRHRETIASDEDPRRLQRQERQKVADEEELSFNRLADLYVAEYVIGAGGESALKVFAETGRWPAIPNPNKKSWKNDVQYLKRPRDEWGKMPAASITDDDAAELLDVIAEDAPVSANRTQSVLHTLFKWGKQPGRRYVQINPVSELNRRGGKERQRDRVLSDDEIRTLWRGLDKEGIPADRTVCLAIRMILTTMVRPYQASGAERGEISGLGTPTALYDMPSGRVKKDRAVLVPLSVLACTVALEASKRTNAKVLFPSKFDDTGSTSIARASISQALNGKKNGNATNGKKEDRIGIREFLGLAHFTAHDLRRTAATLARRAGAKREDVKAMLDHLNGDITAVYDKYDMLPEKRAVADLLGAELQRIIGVTTEAHRLPSATPQK